MKCAKCGTKLTTAICSNCGYSNKSDVWYLEQLPALELTIDINIQKTAYYYQQDKDNPAYVAPYGADFLVEEDRLVKYCGTAFDVRVPDGIRIIDQSAFAENMIIRSVTLPDTVTEIREKAFYLCANLRFVVFSPKLEIVGDSAFAYSGFETGTLPNSLKQLGDGVFSSTNMERVRVPSKVKVIPENAFSNCYFLSEVELCEGVEKIAAGAFNFCERLRTIIIPDSLMQVESAFVGIPGISNVAASSAWKEKNSQVINLLMNPSGERRSETNKKEPLSADLKNKQNEKVAKTGRKVNITSEKVYSLMKERGYHTHYLLCKGMKHFEKQVLKAQKSYAPFSDKETPLLMLDFTIVGELLPGWGSAKSGFVLTDQNLYYDMNDVKGKTALENITSVTIQKMGKESTAGYVVLNTNKGNSEMNADNDCRIFGGTEESLSELQTFWETLLQLN